MSGWVDKEKIAVTGDLAGGDMGNNGSGQCGGRTANFLLRGLAALIGRRVAVASNSLSHYSSCVYAFRKPVITCSCLYDKLEAVI